MPYYAIYTVVLPLFHSHHCLISTRIASPHKASIQIHRFKKHSVRNSYMTTKKEFINQLDHAKESEMLINFDLMRKKIKAALLDGAQIKTEHSMEPL